MLLLTFVGFLLTADSVIACGSSGCCARAPPPPVVNCGGGGGAGCQPGYRCGPYGCARVRALSGITKRIDGVLVKDEEDKEEAYNAAHEVIENEGLVDVPDSLRYSNISVERLTNPNFIFRTCCETRGLPDACLRHCHFNDYTAHTLEQMWTHNDECPLQAANEIQYCAAQGIDHTQCCTGSGVGNTVAGEKCVKICDQRPNRFTELDFSFMPCFEAFESMKRCFFVEIRKRAIQKFGSPEQRAKSQSDTLTLEEKKKAKWGEEEENDDKDENGL